MTGLDPVNELNLEFSFVEKLSILVNHRHIKSTTLWRKCLIMCSQKSVQYTIQYKTLTTKVNVYKHTFCWLGCDYRM